MERALAAKQAASISGNPGGERPKQIVILTLEISGETTTVDLTMVPRDEWSTALCREAVLWTNAPSEKFIECDPSQAEGDEGPTEGIWSTGLSYVSGCRRRSCGMIIP